MLHSVSRVDPTRLCGFTVYAGSTEPLEELERRVEAWDEAEPCIMEERRCETIVEARIEAAASEETRALFACSTASRLDDMRRVALARLREAISGSQGEVSSAEAAHSSWRCSGSSADLRRELRVELVLLLPTGPACSSSLGLSLQQLMQQQQQQQATLKKKKPHPRPAERPMRKMGSRSLATSGRYTHRKSSPIQP